MQRTYHRGAVVSQREFREPVLWDTPEQHRFAAQKFDPVTELPGFIVDTFAKPFRQRRKGPIVRFGRTK